MFKVDGDKLDIGRDVDAAFLQPGLFFALAGGLVYLKNTHCLRPGRLAIGEGVQAGSKKNILANAALESSFSQTIFGVAAANNNMGAHRYRLGSLVAGRIHPDLVDKQWVE